MPRARATPRSAATTETSATTAPQPVHRGHRGPLRASPDRARARPAAQPATAQPTRTARIVTSSLSSPAENVVTSSWTARTMSAAERPATAASASASRSSKNAAVGAPGLRHPVGVEEQHVALVQLEFEPRRARRRGTARAAARRPPGSPPARRPGPRRDPDGRSEPSRTCTRRPLLPQERERGGHEPVVVVLGDEHLVRGGQHVGGVAVHVRERADRVPRRGRHRRGLLALAADVAHRDAPAVGRLEHVVEVAADLLELGGADVGGGELEPGHPGQPRRAAGWPAAPRRPATAGGTPGRPGWRSPGACRAPRRGRGRRRRTAPVRQPGQRQRAVARRSVGDRHADQRGRAQHHQQRRAVGSAAERGRVVGVREQHGLAGRVHLRRASTPGRDRCPAPSAPAGPRARRAGPPRTGAAACPPRSTSMITQSAISPASSRAHRCSVTASLNVLLSSSTLVTAVTMSSRLVIAAIGVSAAVLPVLPASPGALPRGPLRPLARGVRAVSLSGPSPPSPQPR